MYIDMHDKKTHVVALTRQSMETTTASMTGPQPSRYKDRQIDWHSKIFHVGGKGRGGEFT